MKPIAADTAAAPAITPNMPVGVAFLRFVNAEALLLAMNHQIERVQTTVPLPGIVRIAPGASCA
jgi:hypothetical protein